MSQISASASAADSPRNPPDWKATDIARPPAAPSQLISFAIGNDQYGVDIMAVREIKGWSEITHLPKQPDCAACSICAASSCRSSICAAGSARA